MALKRVDSGRAAFTYTGKEWQVVGGTPDGWRFWASGRLYPPPGTYWVEVAGRTTVELRPTATGKALTAQQMLTVTGGDYLITMLPGEGDTLLVTRLA